MRVPLYDLKVQNGPLKEQFLAAVENVMTHQRFVMGEEISAFESEMASYCGAEHAIAVSSGTDALLLALMANDVRPGDEIITSAFTFFATAGVIHRLGAKPVFVDIDPDTFNLASGRLEEAITPNTKGIIPVHMYGRCAPMAEILEIAERHQLYVVEDAAQAVGARMSLGVAGAIGDAGCLSFYPTKNLSALGDAGMVLTKSDALAERMRKLRIHGSPDNSEYLEVGGNFRMDTMQAAFLSVKLNRLEEWSAKRRENARKYHERFEAGGIIGERFTPPSFPDEGHVFHQYAVRTPERDALQEYLLRNEVGSAVYYPSPLHLHPCFDSYRQGDFPESEAAAAQVLSLPVYPELTGEDLDYVADTVIQFFSVR
ncbi:MAG: DegT/DnrJ/EryC1/StrS family aminotransferase [Nitrospinae bacterium]|nr:DegT/DnrJ/EryC1/StrS family aminotransferase [Nitrospinota bacterium]